MTVQVEEGSEHATIERTGSIVEAMFGIFKGDKVLTPGEEKQNARRSLAEHRALKQAANGE